MENDESLVKYTRRKTTELVDILVRDHGMSNTLETREAIFNAIGGVVADMAVHMSHDK